MRKTLPSPSSQARVVAVCFGFMLLCSCATLDSIRPISLVESAINASAGRGDYLFVKLHLEDGKERFFILDTGAQGTIFDKSLEPQLGKPVVTRTIHYASYGDIRVKKYPSPKIYLGNTEIKMGKYVFVDDLEHTLKFNRAVAGVLGMDCLKNYCLQLDFSARKLRLIDSDHLDDAELGKAYPLSFGWFGLGDLTAQMDFSGKGMKFLVDTGDPGDIRVNSKWTTHRVGLETCVVGGANYTNVAVHSTPGSIDALGLRFLARNLVTLNFPKRTMYLKPLSSGPLVDEELNLVARVIKKLVESKQLPGVVKGEKGTLWLEANPEGKTYQYRRADKSVCHYQFVRSDGEWKLHRAWRTDENDRLIEEFPVL